MEVTVTRTQAPYTFHWPNGPEVYDRIEEVAVQDDDGGRPRQLFLAFGFRTVYGRRRRRILVFQNQVYVLAEFVGADDWDRTQQVASRLRRESSRKYLRPDDPVPPPYCSLDLRKAASVFSGPWAPGGIVAVADESDRVSLVGIALVRERVQQGLAAPPWQPPQLPPQTSAAERSVSPGQPLEVPPAPALLAATDAQVRAVVQEMLRYREEHRAEDHETGDPAVEATLGDPFAFLMAACLDRGARVDIIWAVPYHLRRALGHLDPTQLRDMSESRLECVIRGFPKGSRPRFPRDAARTIISLSALVAERAPGDVSALWRGVPVRTLVDTLDGVWGVGPGIAHMVILLLWDDEKYRPAEHELCEV
ncbi:MAG: hypothetical protein HYY04_01550, partial [Chloroflexi bacterium]|nr:hypothetical protein [Chloroflexota bacterium]